MDVPRSDVSHAVAECAPEGQQPDHRSQKPRSRRIGFAGAGVICLIALTGVFFVPLSADAAGLGPGYAPSARPLDHLGGYIAADGRVAYCIDSGRPSAVGGVTSDGGILSQVNGLDEAAMVRLNFVLSHYGNTADDNTAAAVAMTVWSIADNGPYQADGGDATIIRRAPESERAAIQLLANRFRAEADGYTAPAAEAAMNLTIDALSDYEGFLDVMVNPTSATSTVTLANGIFLATGESFAEGVGHGAHLAVRATPPDGSGDPYRISARADGFSAPGAISARVQVYSTPGSQTLVALAPSEPSRFSASALDPRDRLVTGLTTVAQTVAVVGSAVVDVATLLNVPSTGVHLEFAAYLQRPGASAPECSAETLAFVTAAPLQISSDGQYASQGFTAATDDVGVIYWVATVWASGERTAEGVLARGVCGDPAETTTISVRADEVFVPAAPAPPHPARLPIVSA